MPFALVNEQLHTHWLALDSSSIFWTDGENVRACSKTSCGTYTTIESGRRNVTEVAGGGGQVFWSECAVNDAGAFSGGGVFRCPSTGCTSTPDPVWSSDCAIATTYDPTSSLFYWSGVEVVYRCSPATCAASSAPVAEHQYQYISSIAIAGPEVYWLQAQEGLSRCASPNCAPVGDQPVARSQPFATAPPSVVGSFVYWTRYVNGSSRGAFLPAEVLPRIQTGGGAVLRAPRDQDGGSAEVLVNGGAPTAVVADETTLRFTDFAAGVILSCPLEGCDGGASTLAVGQGKPFALVQDESAVYWANYGDGRIMKLAK